MKYLPLLAALAIACQTTAPRPASRFPHHDDLSCPGFAEEALLGFGTPRTPRFDDYTEGSYHVGPLELADRLPRVAITDKIDLQGVG